MSLFSNIVTAGGELGFKPTALYSFEFIPRKNPSAKVEMFLLVPPEQYTMQYGYRFTLHKTIGSSIIDWSGVDNPVISLGGNLWSYWLDQLPAPFGNNLLGNGKVGAILNNFASGFVNKAATAVGSLVSNIFPLNQMSGLEEFFRLKFMLYDFWQTEGAALSARMTSEQLVPTSLNTGGLLPADGIFGGMRKLAGMSDINNLYEIQVIYHDYDDNVHWEIVPQEFRVHRNKDDAFSVSWNATLQCVRDMRKQPFFVPVISKKLNADQIMKDLAVAMVAVNPVNVFKRAVTTITSDIKELSKLSWDGVMAEYELAMSDYFNGYAANQEKVIAFSDKYADTARKAQIEAIQAQYNQTYANYILASSSNTPSTDVIESGRSDSIIAIGNFLANAVAMSGIKAYTGQKFPIIQNNSGKTVTNLPDLDETYFSGSVDGEKITYSDSGWKLYKVHAGDDLGKIAVKELGEYSRFPEIATLNNLKMTDFSLDALVGKTIKLPIEKKTINNKSDNLVYWKQIPANTTLQTLQEEIIGRDLHLNGSRDLAVDNSGDLKITLPREGFQQNISDVVSLPQGVLPLYPEWGNPIQVGQVNIGVSDSVVQVKLENAIYTDPRVRAVFTDVQKTKQVGDRLYFESKVEPLVGLAVSV